ncbi:MAG: hypothetical protein UX13_C0050G0007 [Candidatus Woesebacteria bacterium GW2011_GWB1_45_5]|uniref:DUF4446 domain-containing protein n=1 Tax=Candidatus Woesebacteria bacterium GW2011_GWB1_45_5 TaxID=1618581 RepID=A0A0G1MLS6_9BACT|nr:MAG: hypothetical protein UX13_C0050G0007 [Candidatus Woesebacteria bacterium GW2011_GWB1_45_5]
MQIFYILAAVAGLWLVGMSVVLYKLFKLFGKLTKGVEEDVSKKGFAEVRSRLAVLEEDGKSHIQKVGLARFNPFKELGGDHSFSLAILDSRDSGVVITSLHTRDRTRVYMKDIKKGKGDSELSAEEKKALSKAQK